MPSLHHPEADDRPYGEQVRAALDALPLPDHDAGGYVRGMIEIARIASTAAADTIDPAVGKHRT